MTMQRSMQLATLALLVAGLNASPLLAQGKTFKVGVPLPLTGAEAKFGEMEKQAKSIAPKDFEAMSEILKPMGDLVRRVGESAAQCGRPSCRPTPP